VLLSSAGKGPSIYYKRKEEYLIFAILRTGVYGKGGYESKKHFFLLDPH